MLKPLTGVPTGEVESLTITRRWAWEQAKMTHGTNLDIAGNREELERQAIRLASFIENGKFED